MEWEWDAKVMLRLRLGHVDAERVAEMIKRRGKMIISVFWFLREKMRFLRFTISDHFYHFQKGQKEMVRNGSGNGRH